MKDDGSIPLYSPKGQERAARLRSRIATLSDYSGWQPKAEAAAIRWILERLEYIERRSANISQAQAVAIIRAWTERCLTADDGEPVLDGIDLEGLGIR